MKFLSSNKGLFCLEKKGEINTISFFKWTILLAAFVFLSNDAYCQSETETKEFQTVGTESWPVPDGVYQITVEAYGGGGGGGGAKGTNANAGGGGGGGFATVIDYQVTPGTIVSVTVGGGGNGGGAKNSGITGGTSTVKIGSTTIVSATGGSGGGGAGAWDKGSGGQGGTGSGVAGALPVNGANGSNGSSSEGGNGGNGGGITQIGAGGGGADSGNGGGGSVRGGGGGGGATTTAFGSSSGGSGARGGVRIIYRKPEAHTVTFNLNGATGSKPSNGSIYIGQTYSSACGSSNWIPTRSGYTFRGWCINSASGDGVYIGPEATCFSYSNHTVYAIWEKNVVTTMSVCPNDNNVHLNVPSGYLGYNWSPSTALNSTTVYNPKVNVSTLGPNSTTNYSCSCKDNFIYNSDFSKGNIGFFSHYTYVNPDGGDHALYPTRVYTYTNNPNSVHNGFIALSSYEGDNGKMCVVNGGSQPGDIVLEQTAKVSPNTNYKISCRVARISNDNPAQLIYYVNGVPQGNGYTANSTSWSEYSYNWNSGSNQFATIQIKNNTTAASGNDFALDHFIVTTDASTTYYFTLGVYPIFSAGAISSSGQVICKGETINQIGSSSPATGGDGSITYKWQVSTNGGSYTDIASSNSATFTPSAYMSTGGTYTFKRLAKDGACSDWTASSNTYTLTVNAPAVTLNEISASASTVCSGSSVTLTASTSSSTGTVTYKWSANNSTNNPLTVNPTAQTTYTVTATATVGSCTATATKSKTINIYPTFSAGAISSTGQTICKDATPNAIGSTTAATGGNGSITYKWQVSTNGGSYTDIASSNSATFTPSAYKGTVGTYTFKRMAKDGACQTDWAAASNTYTLTVNAPAVTLNEISASASTVCSGSSVTLTASTSSNTGTVTYKWSNNSTDNPLTVNPTAQTTYTVTATATVGSCTVTDTKSKTINVYPDFSAGAIASTGEEISVGETASEIGSTTAATGGNGSISYQWFAEESLIEGATSASYTPGETYTGVPGTYTFTRKAKDGACVDWTLSENSYVLTVTNSIFEAVTDRGNIAACETVESNESFTDSKGQKVNRPAMSQYGEILNSSECEIQYDCIISFDNNNGQGSMNSVTVSNGQITTLPSNTLTRTNCTFKEWNTERSGCGTALADGATFATDSNVTLYAQWHSYCPGTAHTNESGTSSRIDSVKDHQNNWYEVVQVGTQCWLRENMRCTTSPKTNNTFVVTDNSYSSSSPKAYYYENNTTNVRPKGLLYNWWATIDSTFANTPTSSTMLINRRGICPEGWHVPSHEEWNVWEDFLVGSSISRNLISRTLLASTSLNPIAGGCTWPTETNSYGPGYYVGSNRNSTLFSVVPTGYFCDGSFHFMNVGMHIPFENENELLTGFICSDLLLLDNQGLAVPTRIIGSSVLAPYIGLTDENGIFHDKDPNYNDGYSVRCIRNEVTLSAVAKTDSSTSSLTISAAFTADNPVTSASICAYTDASCTTPAGTCASIAANATSPVTGTITGLAHNSKYYVKVTVNTANGFDSKIAGPFGTKPIYDVITFVADGGSGTMASQSVIRGVSTPIKANAYSHTNWQFLGWNDACDGKGTNYVNQANITTNGNVTLYAQWHSWCNGSANTLVNENGTTSRIDSVKDHQNNWYKVVQIGNQCWLKENMRCTTSPSGKLIYGLGTTYDECYTPKYYNNTANTIVPYRERGLLYSWAGAMDMQFSENNYAASQDFPNHRGICPQGWHIPTDGEWKVLEKGVLTESNGSSPISDASLNTNDASRSRGKGVGQLATKCYWSTTNSSTSPDSYSYDLRNVTGFSVVPTGHYNSAFYNHVINTNFWTATSTSRQGAYSRTISCGDEGVVRSDYFRKMYGFTVRCVRD